MRVSLLARTLAPRLRFWGANGEFSAGTQLFHEEEGVKVYELELPGSSVHVVKAVGTCRSPTTTMRAMRMALTTPCCR